MNAYQILVLSIFVSITSLCAGQGGTITGRVIDANTLEPLAFVNAVVVGTTIGSATDTAGNFKLENVPLGYQKVSASFIGFEPAVSSDILVTLNSSPQVELKLSPSAKLLAQVEVRAELFEKNDESPVSMQTLGVAEIEKNPGGNRDISKVIQSLPGVASNPGFRNDIIIRGGSPGENRFFLDGVEVPVINHFQTQGASGGPVGMINANLISSLDFYSGAFPASRGNALSAIMDFKLKEGNKKKLKSRTTIGSSDIGLTIDGPLNKSTTYNFSFRQSYLQFLFTALKLPFLPTFNDFQLKTRTKLDDDKFLSIIALGALDQFELNEGVNDGITDSVKMKYNEYILGYIPIQEQWNYTIGAVFDKYHKKNGKSRFVLSRNQWNNTSTKYADNDDSSEDNLILKYESVETENKFRFEETLEIKDMAVSFGTGVQHANYTNNTSTRIPAENGSALASYSSQLNMLKYALFASTSKRIIGNRMALSLGIRLDGSTYSEQMQNPLDQFSPRASVSFDFSSKLTATANAGRYYQLPAYTTLGFRNQHDQLVNADNGLTYFGADHLVAGIKYTPNQSTKISVEGFHKSYFNYPFSITNQISLANAGDDFGVVGAEEVNSSSEGRAYGLEFLVHKRSYNGLYGILSYTLVRSEFMGADDTYRPSSWDNNHLLSLTSGYKLKKNWEIGFKFRFIGGRPYTPYDMERSANITNYNIYNRGLPDYSQLNSQRFANYHQLDIRIDKTWYWQKASLNLYLDIQNSYNSKNEEQGVLLPMTNAQGNRMINPNNPSSYMLQELARSSGNVLPSIGIILDF